MQKASKQLIALCLGAWGVIYGQTESRTSLIEAARTEKEANLTPETEPKLERKMVSIENSLPYRLITGESGGLSVGFGNVMPGAGFAAGPQYTRTGLWKGRLNFSVEARASINRSYVGRTDISLSNLFGDRVSLDFSAAHRNISEMAYYGAGPDSRKTGRSNYRLEDTNLELRPAVRVYKGLRSGLIGSYLANNVGPGHSSQYISSERQFGTNDRTRHRPADKFLARRGLRRIRLARPGCLSNQGRQVFGAVRPLPGQESRRIQLPAAGSGRRAVFPPIQWDAGFLRARIILVNHSR